MIPINRISTRPGVLLQHNLEEMMIDEHEFSQNSGIDFILLAEIIDGFEPITQEIADKIGKTLGTSAQMWMNVQQAYNESKAAYIKRHFAPKQKEFWEYLKKDPEPVNEVECECRCCECRCCEGDSNNPICFCSEDCPNS